MRYISSGSQTSPAGVSTRAISNGGSAGPANSRTAVVAESSHTSTVPARRHGEPSWETSLTRRRNRYRWTAVRAKRIKVAFRSRRAVPVRDMCRT